MTTRRNIVVALAFMVLAIFDVAKAWAGCTLKFIDLPVTMSDLRATVPVKINGRPAVLAIDSGAFYSFISEPSAAALHLPLRAAPPGRDVIVGINGEAEIFLTTVKQLTIGQSSLPNLDFLVGGAAIGGDVVGLLGENILARGDVEYDLGHGVMRLTNPVGCGDKMLAYWDQTDPYSVLSIGPISEEADGITSSAIVNGVTMRVVFDTGSPLSYLTLAAARRAGIDPHGLGVVPTGATTGLGRRVLASWIAPVKSFKIGDEEIRNTRLRFADLYADWDMLLGVDFMLSHRIYVANSQRKLYFTYNGGSVFNLAIEGSSLAPPAAAGETTAAAGPEPTDADGFGRRGAAYAARHDYAHAVADLTRAIALAPADASFAIRRAEAYVGEGRGDLALADLDRALSQDPASLAARLARAELRLAGGDNPRALEDLDAAAKAATRQSDARLELAHLYLRADAPAQAVGQFDLWIATHPEDANRTAALGGRCWAKALGDLDARGAVEDCDAAIALAPKAASLFDSRGLARLRLGEFVRAIKDYDTALAFNPKIAWSLYGRGLAELKAGDAAAGKRDLAAAALLDPGLADKARAHGLAP